MPSQGDRRLRLDALLGELLEVEEGEREELLAEATADDPSLRAEAQELLEMAQRPFPALATGLLAGSPLWDDALPSRPPVDTVAGMRVGAWRLVSELGRGGMGTVWLAERADDQFEQRAAVKLLQAGARATALVDRFERERQILAILDHPNIARLLDGGLTDDGRPWFAMEHVDGEPIDVFCDARSLGVEARLYLFVEVVRAVQAAHSALVVHRDLKPSNILVTRDGRPRLLDFGIAKALDTAADPEAITRTVLALTPEYASPEQVRGEPAAVASDVYQLGLLLYELLTGRRAQQLEHHSPVELARVVCEENPPAPSAAVAASGDSSASRARGTSLEALARSLVGDLDAIVSKALRKSSDRRYGSAAELAEDVRRHLHGHPVRARPETLRYRGKSFLRRHPVGAASGTGFALLLMAYASTVTWQARQLALERDQVRIEAARTERVRDFLLELFTAANPYGDKGTDMTAGELVEAGIELVHRELAEEPEIRAELLGVLGEVLMGLGAHERAEELVTEALDVTRELHRGDHADLARGLTRYASFLGGIGDWEGQERYARQAYEMRQRLHEEPHPDVAASVGLVAASLTFLGRYDEAEDWYRRALGLRSRLGLAEGTDDAVLWNNLGVTLDYAGRREEAEEAHWEALSIRRRLFEQYHPAISESLNNLALTLSNQGRLEEAEPLYREALESRRRTLPEGHPRIAVTLHNLGLLLRRAGKLEEAAAVHQEALAIRREFLGGAHSNVAMSLQALGDVARDRGEASESERLYRAALSMFRDTLPAGHPRIGSATLALGRLLLDAGRPEEAEPHLQEALEVRLAATGEESVHTAEARLALGLARFAQGRSGEARDLIVAGLAVLQEAPGADAELVAEATQVLAGLGQGAAASASSR
jgi:eukaryotic-like serine/threonine-protein kinase